MAAIQESRPCTDFPPLRPEEIERNPTQALQREYQDFLLKYKRGTQFYKDIHTYRHPLSEIVKSDSPNCPRILFYYALVSYPRSDREGAFRRIATCARVNNPPSPINDAIRCYSILITNLLTPQTARSGLADMVFDFLKEDYYKARQENLLEFLNRKNRILYLILSDVQAYNAAPQGIKDEILAELRDGMLIRNILSIKPANHPGVIKANEILTNAINAGLVVAGHPMVAPSAVNASQAQQYLRDPRRQFQNSYMREFAHYSGGGNSRLKLKSNNTKKYRRSVSKHKKNVNSIRNKRNKKKSSRKSIKKM